MPTQKFNQINHQGVVQEPVEREIRWGKNVSMTRTIDEALLKGGNTSVDELVSLVLAKFPERSEAATKTYVRQHVKSRARAQGLNLTTVIGI